MTAEGRMLAGDDVWAAADAAEAELREVLYGVGVVLPSLGVDLAATVGGTPLINLGRINLATAQALAKALGRPSANGKVSRPGTGASSARRGR